MGKKTGKDTETVVEDLPIGPGETMDVRMRGPADKIGRRLSLGSRGARAGDAEEEGAPPAKKRFSRHLSNPQYIAIVTRTSPRNWPEDGGPKCDIEVMKFDLPMTYMEIKDEVGKAHGGRKYRLAIFDPAENALIDAEPFTVNADPILKQERELDDLFQGVEQPGIAEQSPLEQVAEATNKQIQTALKAAELEQAKEQLNRLTGRSGGKDPAVELLKAEIAELKRKQETKETDDRFREQLKAIEDRHAREMAELKDLLKQGQAPKEDSYLKLLMEQQKSSDQKFSDLLKSMKDDRLTAISNEIKELKNAKGEGVMNQLTTFKEIAKAFGVDLRGGDGEDEEEEKDVWEKLVDRIPDILETLSGKKDGGKEVTKEDLVREIEKIADEELAKKKNADLLRAQQGRPLPQPPAQAASAAPPLPSAGIPAADQPPLIPAAPAAQQIPTVEQEIAFRTAGVLAVLERELVIRPRLAQWNYSAWQNLPEDVLAEFAAAGTLETGLAAFSSTVPPEGLAKLRSVIATSERAAKWVERGFNELKAWIERAKLDPDFDPMDEDEEEEGDDSDGSGPGLPIQR